MDNFNFEMSAEEELSKLPVDYTRELAKSNMDVIYDQFYSFNSQIFNKFLTNISKGKPDRIRIVQYGIDTPAEISILEFNGKRIALMVDSSRVVDEKGYYVYYGNNIKSIKRIPFDDVVINYFLITFGNKEIPLFTDVLSKK